MSGVCSSPSGLRIRRDLRSMMADGAAFSLMVGIGETYVPAFALALGLGDVSAGLVSTIPMLAGGLLQLVSPWAVRVLGSHRRWVVGCAGVQASSMVLMTALAVFHGLSPWLVYLPAVLYWASGLATGPAWNAWAERLVPRRIRAEYFSQRTRLSHICVLLGLVAGGLVLRLGTAGGTARATGSGSTATGGELVGPPGQWAFALIFGVAAVARLVSAVMLARQSEPDEQGAPPYADARPLSYRQIWREMRGGPGVQLVAYLVSVQVGVYIAAPFFTPFMLRQLHLSYLEYMLLLSCGFLGKFLALPWAGRYVKRWGATRLLWVGGLAIAPLSAGWVVSTAMPFLIVLQVVGGMAWAAFELSMLLLFFEAIPRQHRVGMLSMYNALNALGMVAGGLLGALVMQPLHGRTAYLAVFGLSSAVRLLALVLAPRRAHVPAHDEQLPTGLRPIAVRPLAGSLERPILPLADEEEVVPATPEAVATPGSQE